MLKNLLYKSNNSQCFISECAGALARMLFEEEVEILWVTEAKAIADLRDIPVAVLQKISGF